MATLPNPNISVVPAATGPGVPAAFPGLTSITVSDLVGPPDANRQPNQLDTRSETLRTRVNDLVANSNLIATGEGGGVLFLPRDGSDLMTGALDMGTNLINNLGAGVGAADAIRKDQAMLLDGSQAMTASMDMGSNRITNVGVAVAGDDALTLADGAALFVNVTGDTMAGILSMGGFKITNLADPNPSNPAEALNIGFADGRYVNVAGDTMAGILSMGGFKITNLANPNPSNPAEALNIGFADGRYSNAAGATLNLRLEIGSGLAGFPQPNKVRVFSGLQTVLQDVALGSIPTKLLTVRLATDLDADITVIPVAGAPGVGGLDTLPGIGEAIDTWYFIYLIGDTLGVNDPILLISTGQSVPTTLLAGYDVFRRIGSARNDGSSDFLPAYNDGGFTIYANELQFTAATLPITFASFPVVSFVPPTTRRAYFIFREQLGDHASSAIDYFISNTDISTVTGTTGGTAIMRGAGASGFGRQSADVARVWYQTNASQAILLRTDVTGQIFNGGVAGYWEQL